jgi:hypothetical protein
MISTFSKQYQKKNVVKISLDIRRNHQNRGDVREKELLDMFFQNKRHKHLISVNAIQALVQDHICSSIILQELCILYMEMDHFEPNMTRIWEMIRFVFYDFCAKNLQALLQRPNRRSYKVIDNIKVTYKKY